MDRDRIWRRQGHCCGYGSGNRRHISRRSRRAAGGGIGGCWDCRRRGQLLRCGTGLLPWGRIARMHRLPWIGHGIAWRHHALGISLLRVAGLLRIARWIALRRWISALLRIARWITRRRRHISLRIARLLRVTLRIALRRVSRRHAGMLLIAGRHALGVTLGRVSWRHAWLSGLRIRHRHSRWLWRRIRIGRVLAHGLG
ncbi:MAG: hypothetical protein JWO89_2804 [Verrucomicrobiaceae bacterium]|nr:hypothetical protein [Verrucomicrobiaceae bacterium]